jgi:hypothetical protein
MQLNIQQFGQIAECIERFERAETELQTLIALGQIATTMDAAFGRIDFDTFKEVMPSQLPPKDFVRLLHGSLNWLVDNAFDSWVEMDAPLAAFRADVKKYRAVLNPLPPTPPGAHVAPLRALGARVSAIAPKLAQLDRVANG